MSSEVEKTSARAVASTRPSRPRGPSASACGTLVETRAADYVNHFEDPAHRRFDVFHAQDGISANALATLKERGLIAGFVRTVHHIDVFDDPVVAAMQRRSIVAADRHIVVSAMWRQKLAADFGIEATIVGNGVDRRRYHPQRDGSEPALRERLGLGSEQQHDESRNG